MFPKNPQIKTIFGYMSGIRNTEDFAEALINLDLNLLHEIQVAKDTAYAETSKRSTIMMNPENNPFTGIRFSEERIEKHRAGKSNNFKNGNGQSFIEGTITAYDKHGFTVEEQELLINTVHEIYHTPTKKQINWQSILQTKFRNKIFDLSKSSKLEHGRERTDLCKKGAILKSLYVKFRTKLNGRDAHPQIVLLAKTCKACEGAILNIKPKRKDRSILVH